MSKPGRRKTLVALLILVGGVAGWLALRHSLDQPAAKLSSVTPASQGGYTVVSVSPIDAQGQCECRADVGLSWLSRLLARLQGGTGGPAGPGAPTTVQVGSQFAGGIGVWIREPLKATQLVGGYQVTSPVRRSPQPTVTGTGNAGVPAQARPEVVGNEQLTLISVPGGYPDKLKSLVVQYPVGTASWQIVDLPPSRHIATAEKTSQKIPEANLEVVGSANWFHQPTIAPRGRGAMSYVGLRGRPPAAYHWELVGKPGVPEWEPQTGPINSGSMSIDIPTGKDASGWSGVSIDIPYPDGTRLIHQEGKIVQYDMLEEPVTFRNLETFGAGGMHFISVKRALTARTPSGIKVTLPAQNENPSTENIGGMMGTLHMMVDYDPKGDAQSLPASRLVKTRGPVEVSVASARPYALQSWDQASYPQRISLAVKGALPKRIPTLTLILRQRVNIKEYPFTLNVPIAGH